MEANATKTEVRRKVLHLPGQTVTLVTYRNATRFGHVFTTEDDTGEPKTSPSGYASAGQSERVAEREVRSMFEF